ncbi:hypothetical protein [Virgibacillus pantothenticus]|uniref:hypothetical protein n=1 Tax=Virgibacillus pantothenticus TaxID=1473 RepID=UPI001D6A611E|nr:hypothetical protein [Virgibacillus pantothenticus]MBU8642351.1 hypothetical protein [Virgibacillus pantothenticus]MBU8796802.1 hypothetical protein [Virgibacillus pantothenticus]
MPEQDKKLHQQRIAREKVLSRTLDFTALDLFYFFEQALVVKWMFKKSQVKSTIMGDRLYFAFAYLPIIEHSRTELCFEHAL